MSEVEDLRRRVEELETLCEHLQQQLEAERERIPRLMELMPPSQRKRVSRTFRAAFVKDIARFGIKYVNETARRGRAAWAREMTAEREKWRKRRQEADAARQQEVEAERERDKARAKAAADREFERARAALHDTIERGKE